MRHACLSEARDLSGHIGTDSHHSARLGVHDAEAVMGEARAGAIGEQCFFELDEGWFDAFVSEGGEAIHEAIDGVCFACCLGGHEVLQSCGQETFLRGFILFMFI